MKVPLASSGLRDSDIETVMRVLKSGKLTMGNEVKNFERKMASYLGVKHFVMVNSGSSANLLMIEALMRPALSKPRLNPGDSILVPAIAWPTTIWPLIQLGLNPLFVDIDPSTLALDLIAAQELIDSSRIPVRGLFPIHPLGRALPSSKLTRFAHKNELILINDVCESLGSWSEGKHAGTEGVAGSYSFYFSHHITTMEGGGISTDDDEFADDLRSMRSHGWSRDRSDVDNWTADKSANDSKFLFVSTGYNVRPMEIQAAIGSAQIDSLDAFIEKRRHIASRVSSSLNRDSLTVIGEETLRENPESNSWMLIPILVKGEGAPARKKLILQQLEKLGIETRPILTGNFLAQPAIQRITRHAVDPLCFAEATRITNQAFMVGAHHDLSDAQIDYLCESLSKVGEL
jgi:CDP-6-deoxy-D-xylo-4-hexulose-3-dehydrase